MTVNVCFLSIKPEPSAFIPTTAWELNQFVLNFIGFEKGCIAGIGKVEEFHEWINPMDLRIFLAEKEGWETNVYPVDEDLLNRLSNKISNGDFFSPLRIHQSDVSWWSADFRRAIKKAENRLNKGHRLYLQVS